jgi:hypothetical protein
VGVLLLMSAWSGCISGDQHYFLIAPPSRPAAAEKWWQEMVEKSDRTLLRVLADVSEVHKQNGTSAEYVWYFRGRTMAGWYIWEQRLPVPLPEAAVERIKLRLEREGFAEQSSQYEAPKYTLSQIGCSDEQAMNIWREAASKYGYQK